MERVEGKEVRKGKEIVGDIGKRIKKGTGKTAGGYHRRMTKKQKKLGKASRIARGVARPYRIGMVSVCYVRLYYDYRLIQAIGNVAQ